MKTSTKLIVTGTLLGTLGLAGVARIAYAKPLTPVAIIPEHRSGNQIAQVGDRGINNITKEQSKDQQESAKLQSLAKITPQQAQQAAETAQGAKASSVKLENEDGNLVYAVVIGQHEVKIDAGNGRVLYAEAGNHENEQTKVSRPRSSIRVTEAPGGDGDGETNDDG